MDKPRELLIASCASLARLQLRIQSQLASKAYDTSGKVNDRPVWILAKLDPPSPWLAELSPNLALDGALRKVTLVIAHLLAMVSTPGPIDTTRACVVLQAIGSVGWSDVVRRLANQLDVALPASPIDASHGAALSEGSIHQR